MRMFLQKSIPLLIALFFLGINLFGQKDAWTENFDTGLANSYTTGTQTLSTGDWTMVAVYQESSSNSYGADGHAARINDDVSNANLTTPALNTVGTVSFYYRELNSGGGTFELLKSYDGTNWTSVASQAYAGNLFTLYSYDLDDNASQVYIRILSNDNAGHLIVDEFSVTDFTGGGNTPPFISNIVQTPLSPVLSTSTVSVSADLTDSDGTVTSAELHWGTESGNLINTIGMTLSSVDTWTTDSDISAQTGGTTVYYEILATDDDSDFSTSSEQSYIVLMNEPTNHPTSFSASTDSYSKITVTWTDSDAEGYLIKGSDEAYTSITAPSDGVAESDGALVQNISSGTQTFQFTGLSPATTYYFKVFPYNGSDATINYKTDGTVQQDDAMTSAAPAAPNVFFSEYIEGSSNNKAIEIYNGTGVSIDLSDYTVKLGSNGGDWGNTEVLSGTLDAGEVYVIYNSSADPEIQAEGDISSSVTFYNGDDALGLFYTSILIDVVGEPGNDPGSAWDVAGVSGATAEHTLLRKTTITSGNTDWASSAGIDALSSEWIVKGQDYFGNLGFGGTIWTGTTDSDWATSGNWDADVPAASANARIPDVSAAKAPYPIISGSASVANLTMSTGSTFDIASTGDLTVSGTFTNNGTLNIKSDASGTGSLIEYNGVAANVQQYLSPDKWHYVASPVTSATSDVFTGLYLMQWDEPSETWNYITGTGVSLNTNMQGYATWAASSAATVTFSGSLNTGSKSIGVTNNNIDPLTGSSGFNFVGNPYPSGLDWDIEDGFGWTRNNVASSIYIWNHDIGNYGVYVKGSGGNGSNGVSNLISPHQGFFVYCSDDTGPGAGSGTLSVDNGARTHTNQQILKGPSSIDNFLKLKVSGNNYSDEALIFINSEAGFNFDSQCDAKKFAGKDEAPQLYSYASDNTKLSVNSVPSVTNNLTIALGTEVGAAGLYEMSLTEINGFDGVPLWLEDLQEHKVVSVTSAVFYKFYAEPADAEKRFVLHFSNGETPSPFEKNNSDVISIYQSDENIVVAATKEITGQVKVFDLLGREILSEKMERTSVLEINQITEKGYYIISVNSDMGNFNHKLFIR